jgi:hypothetical protein
LIAACSQRTQGLLTVRFKICRPGTVPRASLIIEPNGWGRSATPFMELLAVAVCAKLNTRLLNSKPTHYPKMDWMRLARHDQRTFIDSGQSANNTAALPRWAS